MEHYNTNTQEQESDQGMQDDIVPASPTASQCRPFGVQQGATSAAEDEVEMAPSPSTFSTLPLSTVPSWLDKTAKSTAAPKSIKEKRAKDAEDWRKSQSSSFDPTPSKEEGQAPGGVTTGTTPTVTLNVDASHIHLGPVGPTPPSLRPKKVAKRGRGRPPTHGEYVGIGAAKKAKQEADKQEEEDAADDALAQKARELCSTRRSCAALQEGEDSCGSSDEEVGGKPAKEMVRQIGREATLIEEVALKSKRLKGTSVRALKDAAKSVREIARHLGKMKRTDNKKALEKENARLKSSLASLQTELEEMRGRMRALEERERSLPQPSPAPSKPLPPAADTARRGLKRREGPPPTSATQLAAPNSSDLEETLTRNILERVGKLVSARLGAMEERLPPEKSFRPPLRAGSSSGSKGTSAPKKAPQATMPKGASEKVAPKGMAYAAAAKKAPAPKATKAAAPANPSPAPKRAPGSTEWTEVSRKRQGKKKEEARPPKAKASTPSKGDGKGQTKAKKANAPRHAAVSLTKTEQTGPTVGEALAQVRRDRPGLLGELGISALNPKRAATGGLLLAVAGEESAVKADRLALVLTGLMAGKGIKVTRPVKMAEARITGLDDSVTPQELANALAAAGSCKAEEIRVGEFRRSARGLSAAWTKLPAAALNKVLPAGHLVVGWVRAKVELLDPRPLQCHRCLKQGHTRANCPSKDDHSGKCYRCGQEGHLAAACRAPPKCTLCAAAGRPAGHRMGGKACSPQKGAAAKKSRAAPQKADKPKGPAQPAPKEGSKATKKRRARREKKKAEEAKASAASPSSTAVKAAREKPAIMPAKEVAEEEAMELDA